MGGLFDFYLLETSDELLELFYVITSGMPLYCADNHHRTANTNLAGMQNYCNTIKSNIFSATSGLCHY